MSFFWEEKKRNSSGGATVRSNARGLALPGAQHGGYVEGPGRSLTGVLPARPSAASRIQRAAHPARAAVEHVGVDHRGGHVPVAQQFLDGANVFAPSLGLSPRLARGRLFSRPDSLRANRS